MTDSKDGGDAPTGQRTAYVPRPPDEIRRDGNHLKNEKSLYLRQHAHNPLDWYPWGEEALARAKAEDKPIFLSIGYSSCHWCHVMEEEVFEKDDVATFMNERFICIKVDREERPDLDAVYMDAVQAMTRRGGWPMSVFLTPDLRPFFGGTYFPHEQFMGILEQIADAWQTRRTEIDQYAATLLDQLSRNPPISMGLELEEKLFTGSADAALANFDETWGGTQGQMKFPTPLRWLFLLHYYRKTGDDRIARIVRTTLDNMGSGGIHDHVGGGFHRYTTETTWLIPHFEKMLYDNGQLATLYIEASVVFDDARYAEIARATLDFMIADMSGDEGGFYGSYDADSGGEEGTFYIWSPEEINEVAGPDEGPPLAVLLGVRPGGNFEGKSVLTRRARPDAVADSFGRPESKIAALVDKWRPMMHDFRAKRVWPGLDKKIVTSWNGLALAALAQGYAVFGEERYRAAAERCAEYLWTHHRREDGRLYRASSDGEARAIGILDDYAFLANGLLELFQATGETLHLERALALIETTRETFAQPEGGFYMTPDGHEAPLGRKVEIIDSVRPSGNAVMLQVLLRAAALTGSTTYRSDVEKALKAYVGIMHRASLEMAWWLDGALKLTGPYYEVVIAGASDSEDTRGLIETFHRLHPAHAVLASVPPTGPNGDVAELLPPAANKTALDGRATAYVCLFGACKAPTTDPSVMRTQILEGWTR
jgi:uncharacterized protein YyaL (SSP411 family)